MNKKFEDKKSVIHFKEKIIKSVYHEKKIRKIVKLKKQNIQY